MSHTAAHQHSGSILAYKENAQCEQTVHRVAGGCTGPGVLCNLWRRPHLQRGQVAPLVAREALLGHELGRPAEQVHARALPEAQQVAHAARGVRSGRQAGARSLPAAWPQPLGWCRLSAWRCCQGESIESAEAGQA